MKATDMAVIVSAAQNEKDDMAAKGLDIVPHRRRINTERMNEKFKDPDDPFRLVFLCAMWLTGFDAPSCSTVYLDKPMKNHTLMQTIARANRVCGDKEAGLIVDYVGVFRNLQRALAIYARGTGSGEMPIRDKAALLAELNKALDVIRAFCVARGVDPASIIQTKGLPRLSRQSPTQPTLCSAPMSKNRPISAPRGPGLEALYGGASGPPCRTARGRNGRLARPRQPAPRTRQTGRHLRHHGRHRDPAR
jgi:hypothetical protein